MKRRRFLFIAGAALAGNLCGAVNQIEQTITPLVLAVSTVKPQLTSAWTATPPATSAPQAPSTQPPTSTLPPFEPQPTQAATATATAAAASPSESLVDDLFTGAESIPTLTTGADSARQVSRTESALEISGVAPGQNDPSIYDSRLIQRAEGQVLGARYQVDYGCESARVGLSTPDGQVLASIRRTSAEGEGGIIECGAQAFPVLNQYSGCWYDALIFLQAGGAAFAINDGAGAELVLVSDGGEASAGGETNAGGESGAGYLGYWAAAGQRQGARIQSWYAPGPRFFPPTIVDRPAADAGFAADLGTNAAWVEARIHRVSGEAGLRIRSMDPNNEYRVYLDGTNLRVDQASEGTVYPVTKQEIVYVDGAKLAARYNELTLTVYYNGAVTGVVNRKIGAAALMAGSRAGVYSTDPGNTFTNFIARSVRLALPEALSKRQLDLRQVMCLGDSLTTADKAYGYQNRLRKRLGNGWVTVDCGVMGHTTNQMLLRLPAHLNRYRPEVLVVLGGTNDIDRSYPAETVEANLQAIYHTARRAGMRVAAVTIPPIGGSKTWTQEKQAILEHVNDWIRNGAASVDYIVDLYPSVVNPGGTSLQAHYDSGDHIHLSPNGAYLLGDLIFSNVKW